MEQLLSQDEIDALLKGISDGEVETSREEETEIEAAPVSGKGAAREPVKFQVFDFAKYTKGRKEKLSALEFISDRLSKSLRSALTLFLEREVEINIAPTQYVQYGEFIKTLPLPTNMNIVITDNLKGFLIVIFDAKLIFCVLETVFGSNTITVPKIEGREFTKIEFNVIKKLVDLVSNEMEKAWEPVYEIRCRYSRSEINPNYITMVSAEETVVVFEFMIEIADVTGWMKICMPYGILETIKGYLLSTPSREDLEMREKWFHSLQERVKEVPLEVKAVLGRKRISVKEFLNIKKNSLIVMDTVVDEPIDVEIMRRTKLRGRMGIYKGNKAVRIEEIIV
ncbi:MAG: Flagellar motor switch protein FliM [Syntrophorhabdaceae bacterium PtaU1.Bin034]|nr:MAG: Flagellar motor switch protein FliM [Syntrophorhabdaceae bacterium PtaU1.Bin034]